MRVFWVLPCVAMMVTGCRIHDLNDGHYTFTVTQVIRDECDLESSSFLTTAGLVTTGNTVNLALATPPVTLTGIYKDGVQEIVLDGALTNYEVTVRGQTCLLDSLTLHSETVTTSPTSFNGSMSVTYDARTPDTCVCKYWFQYQAQQ